MEFKKYKMEDISTFSQGKQVEIENQYTKQFDNMKRFLRIIDFTNPNEPIRYVEDYGNRYYVTKEDLVMIRYGSQTCGKVAIGKEGIIANNMFKINLDNSIVLNRYAYYFLKQDLVYNYLRSSQNSSTMPSINFGILNKLEIEIPNLDNQRKIVKVLCNIDKKIESNNKINNNLFELLKQEFREKFYNKKEKDSYLRDYISETIGGDWGKSAPEGNNNTMVYCVRGADIPSMEYGNKGNAPIRYILEKNYKNKKLDPNNIIIEISGGSPTQSTGRTAFITKSILDMYDSPLLCTNFCRAIEAKSDILAPFVYLNLKLMYDDDIFFNWENGTTGIKNLALNDLLNNLKVKTPDEMMLKNFYLSFNNIMNKISNNSNENIKLEQLRDTLLPKLMNGEIDLDNIEI